MARQIINRNLPKISPLSSGILQRKCGICGQHTIAGGQCNKCQEQNTQQKSNIQRKGFLASNSLGLQNSFGPKDKSSKNSKSMPLEALNSQIIQPKLKIGAPNDKYEQEADRIADRVMRMPEPNLQRQMDAKEMEAEEEKEETLQTKPIASQITPLIQRQAEPSEEEETLQTKSISSHINPSIQRQIDSGEEEVEELQAKEVVGQKSMVTPPTQARIHAMRGGGQPLPESMRAFYEPRFGMDLSRTRIHTGPASAEAASSLNARAFTIGKDIFFNQREFNLSTFSGKHLLAHELVHTLQQMKNPKSQTVRRVIASQSKETEPVPLECPGTEKPIKAKWNKTLEATLIDVVLHFDGAAETDSERDDEKKILVSLDRAILIAKRAVEQIESKYPECILFDGESLDLETFEKKMGETKQSTLIISKGPLEILLKELNTTRDALENVLKGRPISFSQRHPLIESLRKPRDFFQKTVNSVPKGQKAEIVAEWVRQLGISGLNLLVSSKAGREVLVQAYATLWQEKYDEKFLPTGDLLLSVLVPSRGILPVAARLPGGELKEIYLQGKNLIIKLPFKPQLLIQAGTSKKHKNQLLTRGWIKIPALSLIVLVKDMLEVQVPALKLLQYYAKQPKSIFEAASKRLQSGSSEVEELSSKVVDMLVKEGIDVLSMGKELAIESLEELVEGLEVDDVVERKAKRVVELIDNLGDALLFFTGGFAGVTGGFTKGAAGVLTGAAGTIGEILRVADAVIRSLLKGELGPIESLIETWLVALVELPDLLKSAIEAWIEAVKKGDAAERGRLIGDAVGHILAAIAEFFATAGTGTVQKVLSAANKAKRKLRQAVLEAARVAKTFLTKDTPELGHALAKKVEEVLFPGGKFPGEPLGLNPATATAGSIPSSLGVKKVPSNISPSIKSRNSPESGIKSQAVEGQKKRSRSLPDPKGDTEPFVLEHLRINHTEGDWEFQKRFRNHKKIPGKVRRKKGQKKLRGEDKRFTIPDAYNEKIGVAVEAKRYDYSTYTQGEKLSPHKRLISDLKEQYAGRIAHLPKGTKQWLYLDFRGQGISDFSQIKKALDNELNGLYEKIKIITDERVIDV